MRINVQQVLLALGVTLGLFAYQAKAEMTPQCEYKVFPLFAGGTSKEYVNCFAYDPSTQLIIVGGNTTSEDFAPAANDHGYLFAIDIMGNWKWGKFFYNVSYAVSDVSGCQLSSDGKSMAIYGMGNSQPIVMDINTESGSINRFISIEYWETSEDIVPSYKTWGALYYDTSDFQNGQEYFYMSFVMDSKLEFLRLLNSDPPLVDWSFEFTEYDTENTDVDPQANRKDPQFLHADPRDNQMLYLTGRHEGAASIMKFQKRNAKLRWWATFGQLTNIRAYAQVPDDDHFYACGDFNSNEAASFEDLTTATYTAGIFRIRNDGDLKWYISAQGTNPGNPNLNQDRCYGIAYNLDQAEVTVLLQVKMKELRYFAQADFYDTVLMVLDPSGDVHRAVSISNYISEYDMYSATQGLIQIKEDYFFSGWSYGFRTRLQTLEKDEDDADYDAYVYKYVFGRDASYTSCLYEQSISLADARRQLTKMSISTISQTSVYSLVTNAARIEDRMTRHQKYFYPYTSRYSGGFNLLDTLKIPKACAYKSANLTAVEYYRGQNALQYNIANNNPKSAFVVTLMDASSEFVFQDGTSAAAVGRYAQDTYSVFIQTDSEDLVGVQKTIIRNCDGLSRLLELNLYIDVLSNSHPDFVEEIETSFTLTVGEEKTIVLPKVEDSDGNDIPVVVIDKMEAQEDKFPPFLNFRNDTNTIIMRPDSEDYQGRTYYFTIIVKEKNSDSVKYPYYCTIKMTGEIIEKDYSINYTDINYTITFIKEDSSGQMQFTSPVNMTYLEENFYSMFKIFWRDTTYRTNNLNHTLQDFEITKWGDDNMTIDFMLTFAEPYKLGLLVKKSDKLFIEVKDGFNYSGLFFGNATEHRLLTKTDFIRIEMIFDFRNPVMATMRKIAANMYWVLIALVAVQFMLLIWRGVGLLNVWVLIEYMQLVAFMPIYNFRLIPYLYDAFKPCLVFHMIIFDETPLYPELDDEYFNKNYEYYWLSVGRLFQSFMAIVIFMIIVLVANLIVFVIYKMNVSNSNLNTWAKKRMIQFKYNAYVRYYMLIYFDVTFFAVMKIIEGNNTTTIRKINLLLSYVLFVVSIVLPVFLIALIYRRFDVLKLKEAKQSFNSLLLKIDKASKWRVMNPAYFFARRLLTAMLLTLPIDNTFIFLQYVFILMSSHAYILYMVAVKPFQTPAINSYVLANETFYSALIIAIFIFSDATPELNIKFGAGVALMASLVLLVLANIAQNIYTIIQGPEKLKKKIKESKLKRAEKEALEKAEEEERRLKKKKEEEEFTKLPDDNMSGTDNNTITPGDTKGSKKGKKKDMDQVEEASVGGVGDSDLSKKRRRGKEKGRQDDVTEGSLDGPNKKSKKNTDFGTSNTKQDFL